MLGFNQIHGSARAAARLRHLLLACGLLLSACKLDQQPATVGGLVVAIDADMSTPKDLDEVRLDVLQGANQLFQHTQTLAEGAAVLPLEFEVPQAPDNSPVVIRLIGFKSGTPRVERSAIVTVPTSYLGYVRLPLTYLCDGMVGPNGESTCGGTDTCIQGSCRSAVITSSLPDYYQRAAVDGVTMTSLAASTCFDVSTCMNMASEVTPDPDKRCSFRTSMPFSTDINVGLRLEPGSAGICTGSACWIMFDADVNGFRIGDDQRVFVPESICEQRGQGTDLRVGVSLQCPSKTPGVPLCRDTEDTATTTDPDQQVSVSTVTGPPVGDACAGGGQRACEMCGSQTRMCQSGLWSEFSACADQGVCVPDLVESCGVEGIRTCGGDCTWGECENQTCDGPATRSCGNCGTQHRGCNNGVWTEWSPCSEEGVCAPGTTQACGTGGTQACGGGCQWSACDMQVCEGAAVDACGACGSRTRSCDPNTGEWSDWGACEDEGECRPDSTVTCGRSGTQTCGGNCRWDLACTGQTCEGPARRSCGWCGTQVRTCDMNTGEYSDWSACFGEGECEPNSRIGCGSNGERVCGGNCRWGFACTGQTCAGVSTNGCGYCGIQSRSCDTNSGQFFDWGECRAQGDCAPGDRQTCASGGTRTCSSSCRWDTPCACPAGQHECRGSCVDRSVDSCANCRACPSRTNARATGCNAQDQCQYECLFAYCNGRCCGRGQACEQGECVDPPPVCSRTQHECNGTCVERSASSCTKSCSSCPARVNAIAVGCSAQDQCQYRCVDASCQGTCCAPGQVCGRDGRCQTCTGTTRNCNGVCVPRSGSSCANCQACRELPNAEATGCDTNDQCQYTCKYADCRGTCCPEGQVCGTNGCEDPLTCTGNLHECDGRCVVRSANSCGAACQSCPPRANTVATCNTRDECQYSCAYAECDGTCCARGQVCGETGCEAPRVSCTGDTHECDGECVARSVWSCTDCQACPLRPNQDANGCSDQDVCQYGCRFAPCNGVCCGEGQMCRSGVCADPPLTCTGNTHACDGRCVTRSASSCTNCAPCSLRANADVSCSALDQCQYACRYEECNGICCAEGQVCGATGCEAPRVSCTGNTHECNGECVARSVWSCTDCQACPLRPNQDATGCSDQDVCQYGCRSASCAGVCCGEGQVCSKGVCADPPMTCGGNTHACDGRCVARSGSSCANCEPCPLRPNADASCSAADQCEYACRHEECRGTCCAEGQVCGATGCEAPRVSCTGDTHECNGQCVPRSVSSCTNCRPCPLRPNQDATGCSAEDECVYSCRTACNGVCCGEGQLCRNGVCADPPLTCTGNTHECNGECVPRSVSSCTNCRPCPLRPNQDATGCSAEDECVYGCRTASCNGVCCGEGQVCRNGACADPPRTCGGNTHECNGECVPRSVSSCTNCRPCPSRPNQDANGCSEDDECVYGCRTAPCNGVCCGEGQVCSAGACAYPPRAP